MISLVSANYPTDAGDIHMYKYMITPCALQSQSIYYFVMDVGLLSSTCCIIQWIEIT